MLSTGVMCEDDVKMMCVREACDGSLWDNSPAQDMRDND